MPTVEDGCTNPQPTDKASLGLDSFDPGWWLADSLPLLDGIGPLLPGGAEKRPLVGDGWEEHPGLSIDQLQAAAPECICWHVGADTRHIGIDIDGAKAAAFCQSHDCDPYTADTWRIIRTSNTERLKLVFTVTPEQKAALVAGAKTVKIDGQEFAVFAKPGTQIVVLGQHYTKESGFTENDDQYAWAGRAPADAQPLPPEWFALLTGVFCGDRPLKPPTQRKVSAPSSRKANAYSSSGDWSNSSKSQPCPVCGRDHSGACSINSGAVWCCHGETKSAPDCSRAGEIVPGADGQQWGYVRTEEHDSFGERSLFVLHQPRQPQNAKTPPPRTGTPLGDPGTSTAEPASFQALIQQLPDGWRVSEKTGAATKGSMSAGELAEKLPSVWLRFNEMTLRAEVSTTNGWVQITDADMDSAYVVLTGKGWKVGLDPTVKAVLHVARQAPHHPVRDYLRRLEADPTVAPFDLDKVAKTFFRAQSDLHAEMVRKWLIGAVARALEPGCKMDYCLVFKGGQGQKKSWTLETLGSPEWHCSSIPEGEKDLLLNVHSTWIYELAELESVTGRKEAGRLKNLITTRADLVRVPYGRTSERMPRQSVFCATVNEDTFLRDDTGNRRYWVVPVEGGEPLDREGLLAARDGIWRAAVAAYRAGELPVLSAEMELLSAQQNEDFNAQDPWVEMVRAWMAGDPMHRWDPDRDPSTVIYSPDRPVATADVIYSAGLRRPDQIGKADQMRAAAVLRQLGFKQGKQQRVDGRAMRLWEPSQPSRPVTTSKARGCDTQNPCAAMDLGLPSQLSQPKTMEKAVEVRTAPASPAPAAHVHPLFGKQVVTVVTPLKTVAAQSICLSQPPKTEVVTPPEVVTPQRPAWADAALAIHQSEPAIPAAAVAIRLETEHGFPGIQGRQVKAVWQQHEAA